MLMIWLAVCTLTMLAGVRLFDRYEYLLIS
jgi:hypothetical protein